MCSNADTPAGSAPVRAVQPQPQQPALLPLDQYRLQLYNYAMAERLRFTQLQHYPSQVPLCPGYPAPYGPRLALSMSLFHHRVLQPEEPKPQHSYIGLIAMAILSSPDHKLVLSDIYQHILDNYPYFRSRGPGWRNSIRHNLSLNDCFIKAGRSANGKGHYWAIHPANVEDFSKGDFRRRKAQRKVRKHMGLAVDDDGNDSPSPPPLSPPPTGIPVLPPFCNWGPNPSATAVFPPIQAMTRKRQFDVASLLAPDAAEDKPKRKPFPTSSDEEDVDVVASDQEEPNERPTSPTKIEPQSPTAQYPLLTGWGMFPGFGMDQNFIAKYYEQLAAVQYQKRTTRPATPTNENSPSAEG